MLGWTLEEKSYFVDLSGNGEEQILYYFKCFFNIMMVGCIHLFINVLICNLHTQSSQCAQNVLVVHLSSAWHRFISRCHWNGYNCNNIKITHFKLTLPLMLGSLVGSIFPTSHVINLVTGSNEYFPWLVVSVTFRTVFGNGISTRTFST